MVRDITDKIHECMESDFATELGWKGSMEEYLCLFKNDPRKYMRTAIQYLSDMIQHYGYTEVNDCGEALKRYKVFDDCFGFGEAVYGQDRTLMKLVSQIKTIAYGGGSERIILLKGPVATAKTTIVRQLLKGMEQYSKTSDGGIYTFNWVFPDTAAEYRHLGFNADKKEEQDKKCKKETECHAHLKASEASIIPCQLNDSPLLLYPPKKRRELLEQLVETSGKSAKIPKKLLHSELCYNCQTIYERLLEEYNGNINEIFNHVQVVRLACSEIRKAGIATIQPVENIEGNAPLIAMDSEPYSKVVSMLKGIELHRFQGKWVDANRGIMHYSDMFKRNAHYLQYLLSAVQENIVDFNGGMQGYVDVVIVGTTNQEELHGVMKSGANKGLIDRIRQVSIGYILQPKEEAKIYEKQFNEGGYKTHIESDEDRHISPHVVDMLAMWSVMTRIYKPNQEHFTKRIDADQRVVIKKMSPIVKAKLYDGKIHETLKLDAKMMLANATIQRMLRNEFSDEGLSGVSPRLMQNVITDIISKKDAQESREGWKPNCLSIERIVSGIGELLVSGREDLVLDKQDDGFRDPYLLLAHVREEYDRIVSNELRKSFIGVSEEKRKALINLYLKNLFALNTKSQIYNPITKTNEPPDIRQMEYVENLLCCNSEQEKKEFRGTISLEIGKIQLEVQRAKGLDSGMLIDMDYIYDDIFSELEEEMFVAQRNRLGLTTEAFKSAVNSYKTPKFNELLPEQKGILSAMLEDLAGNRGYCMQCAKDTICEYTSKNILKAGVENDEQIKL